jgi:CRISPR-associated protein Cmr6
MTYCIPHEAAEIFGNTRRWSNAGLVFDRYAPDVTGNYPKEYNPKKEGLKRVIETQRDEALRKAMLARWHAGVASVNAKTFQMCTEWRLVSGVGRNTPYEVGFRFDRYGFATLPGSGVKGIARAYAWSIGCENTSDFIDIFGYAPAAGDRREAQTGRAVFFDAMPIDDPVLELDVMTPHYPKYYQGTELPTNWQSPVPIYFLTVKAGVCFEFAVGWRRKQTAQNENEKEKDERLHKLAEDWLKGGLTELGAGAKTNAGYGYFMTPHSDNQVSISKSENQSTIMLPSAPEVPLVAHKGTIIGIRRDKHYGKVQDDQTKQEYRFDPDVITPKDYTPGNKGNQAKVNFYMQGEKVVKVTKA